MSERKEMMANSYAIFGVDAFWLFWGRGLFHSFHSLRVRAHGDHHYSRIIRRQTYTTKTGRIRWYIPSHTKAASHTANEKRSL